MCAVGGGTHKAGAIDMAGGAQTAFVGMNQRTTFTEMLSAKYFRRNTFGA
jgi:hypothetical protein